LFSQSKLTSSAHKGIWRFYSSDWEKFRCLSLAEAMARIHFLLPQLMLLLASLPRVVFAQTAAVKESDLLAACPGYKASNVQQSATGVTADLTLGGTACDVFGDDLEDLTLEVTYDTGKF